ncbi:hypothetical protein ACGFNU_49345 [Spirillospora sp. NPDC048911]|uniref:hypothetical protein n=1 Tax=Spirillospora sp. NPDC048911 TaxID=3364527 RepID=UPI003714E7E3
MAPSYGFDLVPVLRHAWFSWWAESTERVLLLGLLVFIGVRYPLEGLLVVVVLVLGFFCWRCLQMAPKRLQYARYRLGLGISGNGPSWRGQRESSRKPGVQRQRSRHFQDEREQLTAQSKLHMRGVKICAAILIVMFMFDIERRGAATSVLRSMVIVVMLATAAGIVGAVLQQSALMRLRHARPVPPGRLSRRMERIAEQQVSPVTIYSGSRSFVGAGLGFRRWSIAQRLIKAKGHRGKNEQAQEWEELPFKTEDLLGRLSEAIEDLRTEDDPELRLPGLTVKERVFVKGVRATSVLRRVAEKGTGRLVAEVLTEPGGAARHYLVCTVVSWDGDLVALVFVHMSLQGRTLYLEFVPQELRPPQDLYNVIEEPGGTGGRALLSAIVRSLEEFPFRVFDLWRLVLVPAVLCKALLAWRGPEPSIRRAVDIGARASARENATGLDHDNSSAWDHDEDEFQTTDVVRSIKIIQRRLLSTVEDFLGAHKVDTSEFRDYAMTIIKGGIVNMGGGTVTAQGNTFGDHSGIGKPSSGDDE